MIFTGLGRSRTTTAPATSRTPSNATQGGDVAARRTTNLAPGPTSAAIGEPAAPRTDARRPTANAQTVGLAVPRSSLTIPTPPNTSASTADAASAAQAAASRARRRGAGTSVLTGRPVTGAPGARIMTRRLLGY